MKYIKKYITFGTYYQSAILKRLIKILLILQVITVIYSCSKNETPEKASIIIHNPLPNTYIQLPDTIDVSVTISYSKPIEYIRLSIDNSNMVPLSEHIFIYPTENTFSGEVELILEKQGESVLVPPNYIHIVIGDNGNVQHHYQEIILQNDAVSFHGFATFEDKPVNLCEIKYYNNEYLVYNTKEYDGIYSISENTINKELVYLSTTVPELLRAIDIHSGEVIWTKEPQLPYPKFTGMQCADEKLYLSTEIGRIVGVNEGDGSTILTTPVLKDTIPRNLIATNNFIFADFTLRTSNRKVWASFYKPTGVKYLWYASELTTIDIYGYDADKAILIGHNDNSGSIILFDIQSNTIEDIYNFDISFDNSCEIEEGRYLITDNALIYEFSMEDNSNTLLYQGNDSIVDIKYEPIHKSIYIASSQGIEVISYPVINSYHTITGYNNLKSIELLYIP